jgi:hypothetical protein
MAIITQVCGNSQSFGPYLVSGEFVIVQECIGKAILPALCAGEEITQ